MTYEELMESVTEAVNHIEELGGKVTRIVVASRYKPVIEKGLGEYTILSAKDCTSFLGKPFKFDDELDSNINYYIESE